MKNKDKTAEDLANAMIADCETITHCRAFGNCCRCHAIWLFDDDGEPSPLEINGDLKSMDDVLKNSPLVNKAKRSGCSDEQCVILLANQVNTLMKQLYEALERCPPKMMLLNSVETENKKGTTE